MSGQHQINYQKILGTANCRSSEPQNFMMPVLVSGIDNANVPHNTFLPQYIRNAEPRMYDHVHYSMYPLYQPPFQQQIAPEFVPYYSHVLQNSQDVRIQESNREKPTSPETITKTREKKVLIITDPTTKQVIPIEHLVNHYNKTVPADVVNVGNNLATNNINNLKIDHSPIQCEVTEPKPKHEENDIPIKEVVENHVAECKADDISPVEPEITQSTEVVEKDDCEAEEAYGRIRYTREEILKLKVIGCKINPESFKEILNNIALFKKSQINSKGAYVQKRIIKLPAAVALKRVEEAFVPSKLRSQESEKDVADTVKFSREVNIILNRLSEHNVLDVISDIKKINFPNPTFLDILAKLVFDKAISQLKYLKAFVILCQHLKDFQVQNSEKFLVLIVGIVQQCFDQTLESMIAETNKKLDEKIAAAKDPAVKALLEEDREGMIIKQTDAYYGNVSFLAELFRYDVINSRIILNCLKKLKDSTNPEAFQCLLILLNGCGQELDKDVKNIIDVCFNRLDLIDKNQNLEPHQRFKLQELFDLRARGWKPLESTEISQPSYDNSNNSKRMSEDNQRRPYVQNEKRRTAQNVRPSVLTVTQQLYNSRKLCPTRSNWTKGSGLFDKSENSTKPDQVNSNRSGETSPHVLDGIGAWKTPLTVKMNPQKNQKDYDAKIGSTKEVANKVLIRIQVNDYDDNIIESVKEDSRSALIYNMIEFLMDKNKSIRVSFSELLVGLLDRNVIKQNDVEMAFHNFFKSSSDWMVDYPQLWVYVAEMIHRLLRNESDYMSLILKIVEPLISENSAAIVVGECIYLNLDKFKPENIVRILRANQFDWTNLGLAVDEEWSYLCGKSLEFTLFEDTQYKRVLSNLISDPSKIDKELFCKFFTNLSSQTVSKGLVCSLMNILIEASGRLFNFGNNIDSNIASQPIIESFVTPFGILIDHKPEREYTILCELQAKSSNSALVEAWLFALIEKKLISSETITQWIKNEKSSENYKNLHKILTSNPALCNF